MIIIIILKGDSLRITNTTRLAKRKTIDINKDCNKSYQRNLKEDFFHFDCLGMLWPMDLGEDPQRLFVEEFGLDILPSLRVKNAEIVIFITHMCIWS